MSSGIVAARRLGPALPARGAALRRAAEQGVFGLVPVLATLALIAYQFKIHAVAVDFHVAYYPAAKRLLEGLNPYAVTHGQILRGTGFVYPALSAAVFLPFALLGRGAAQTLYMLLCIGCVPATLRTLNVRDWRVYGLAMLWLPVFVGWQSGNVTLPLTLVVALTWRHRDRPIVAGLLVAVAVSIKPFTWPLGLWLLATRRRAATAYALAWGVAINGLAWAIVGYDQISHFLRLSAQDTSALWRGGYSMLALAYHLGFGRPVGDVLLLGLSLVAAGALIHLGHRRRLDREALAVAVAVMLLASPLLWSHYFALLLVPLALRRPRLSPVWALPLLMWPIPPRQPVHGWEEALAWAIAAVCIVVASAGAPGRGGALGRARFSPASSS